MNPKKDFGSLTIKGSIIMMEWPIEKFFSIIENPQFVWSSPTFQLPGLTGHLRITKYISSSSTHVVTIRLVSDKHLYSDPFKCIFSIKNENGGVTHGKTSTTFNTTKFLISNLDGAFVLSSGHKYRANDTVVFCLQMILGKSITHCSKENTHPYKGVPMVHRNLRDMYDRSICCDVTFKLGVREFRAHKSILSVNSPVFASMFEHDMKEKSTGLVEIKDCDPDSFQEFLAYMYTGDTKKFSMETILNLYTIADKYDVKHLMQVCVQFMMDNLSIEVFCDVFQLAVKYKELSLKNSAEDFFVKNIKRMITTVKWQAFINENGAIANDLFIEYLKRKNL